jgi:murein DD-endopeptidase MepM/ murein hydrolase activator NlpD
MAKRSYTLTIAWPDGSKTYKIVLPSWLLYLGGFANLVGILTLTIFLVNFSRMSIKVLEFNRLRSELEGLKIENEMYHASTTQLGEKIWSLESLAGKLSVAVGLEKKTDSSSPADISSVTFPVDDSASESLVVRTVLLPELRRLRTNAAGLEGKFLKIDRYYSDQTTRHAHTPNMWPVLGLLWDRFGWRDSVSEIGEAEYHNGIDICAPYGYQVLASADGVVALMERRPDYGNLIIIDHGSGLTTRYAHLSGFMVSQGERVKRGQIIGLVGKTGRATGPHLHYEVRLNGNPVNPLRYISKPSKG